MNKIRIVFDSNVYIAAALRPGGHADIWLDVAASPSSALKLCASDPILQEVSAKLTGRFAFDNTEVDAFIRRIQATALLVSPVHKLNIIEDDPDDNAILECAVTSKAQLIATSDHHLLRLRSYQGIGICHPRDLKYIFATDYRGRRG